MKKKIFIVCSIVCIMVVVFAVIQYVSYNSIDPSIVDTKKEIIETQFKVEENAPSNTKTVQSPSKTKELTRFASLEDYENESKYGQLPASLEGTNIDGTIEVDENGKLILSQKIRSLFEYFMSAMNEEGEETTFGRIEEYIQLTLPPDAAMEALGIFHSYFDYKKSLVKFNSEVDHKQDKTRFVSDLKKAIYERMAKRSKSMSPDVVDAFFADEEAYDIFTVGRLEIDGDPNLSAQQKQVMMEELEEQLPAKQKERRSKLREQKLLEEEIAAMKLQDGNEQKIYQMRKEGYGKEAADRFLALDNKRNELNNKLKEYKAARKTILASSEISDEEKLYQIEKLEENIFTEQELVEIKIIERIGKSRKI